MNAGNRHERALVTVKSVPPIAAQLVDESGMPNSIGYYRKKSGLSRDKLAEMVGTSTQQVEKLERGVRRLTVEWMRLLADPLGVSPAELMDRRDKDGINLDSQQGVSVKDPDKLALLQFWDAMDDTQRGVVRALLRANLNPGP